MEEVVPSAAGLVSNDGSNGFIYCLFNNALASTHIIILPNRNTNKNLILK